MSNDQNLLRVGGRSFDGLDMMVTSFEIVPQPSVSSLLQELLTDSTGVGPGKSLADNQADALSGDAAVIMRDLACQ